MCRGAGGSVLLWADDRPKGGRRRAGRESCVSQRGAEASAETGLFQGHADGLEMATSREVRAYGRVAWLRALERC